MGGRSLKALRVGVAVAWQGAFFPCEKTPQSPGPFEVLAFLKMSCFFHVLHRVNISRRNNSFNKQVKSFIDIISRLTIFVNYQKSVHENIN